MCRDGTRRCGCTMWDVLARRARAVMITHLMPTGVRDNAAAESAGRRNWAGNYAYAAPSLHVPGTIADVQRIVAESRFVKALGTRHSFNAIADSPGAQISLER